MKFTLFSVFDGTAGVYLQPFIARSEVDAKRQIAASFENPEFRSTPVGRNPETFYLYGLATFDDETGDISGFAAITRYCSVAELAPRASTVSS